MTTRYFFNFLLRFCGIALAVVIIFISQPLLVAQQSDVIFQPVDRERCLKLLNQPLTISSPDSNADLSMGDRVIQIARSFIDAPYEASTLEQGLNEPLTINLRQFDCTTLVESVLALARSSARGDTSLYGFQQSLTEIRYRNGERNGYTSRLHYFYDWILHNDKRGIVKHLTSELGGTKTDKQITFMSSNPKFYPFDDNSEEHHQITQAENNLNKQHFFMIPKDEVGTISDQLQSGDIIAFVANRNDLDIYHNGFAVRNNETGRVHLLHASTLADKVVISQETLAEFVQSSRYLGITVARPLSADHQQLKH